MAPNSSLLAEVSIDHPELTTISDDSQSEDSNTKPLDAEDDLEDDLKAARPSTVPIHNQSSPLASSLTDQVQSWRGAHLVSVSQLTLSGLHLLMETAREMRRLRYSHTPNHPYATCCAGLVLASVFYEASTRTSCSFQAAMLRLGGQVLHIDASSSANSSASKKGESLSDTLRCLECYTDVTVLRHFEQGRVASVCHGSRRRNPLLNAGDGVGEHPTQALLDVFTIFTELDRELSLTPQANDPPLVVTMVGDLKHGRTVHSLAPLLAAVCPNLVLRYCAPTGLEMPAYLQEQCSRQANCVTQESVPNLAAACQGANVLYVTRIQKERFASVEEYQAVEGTYTVTKELVQAHPQMVVMHPLPRVDEIETDVDDLPNAAYFRQMENGMYVRMALLALVLGKVPSARR